MPQVIGWIVRRICREEWQLERCHCSKHDRSCMIDHDTCVILHYDYDFMISMMFGCVSNTKEALLDLAPKYTNYAVDITDSFFARP